ncbi:hypothetical protein HG531_008674 [Fusarium graminearum]|nr:hypothetical protein HG531_008674 [Fusarium graminearum]
MFYLLLSSGTENSAAAVHLGRDVGDVLASKDRPHIAKVLHGVAVCALLTHVPCGAVNRRVDVAGLHSKIVLISDAGVVDVYESVGRAREEKC